MVETKQENEDHKRAALTTVPMPIGMAMECLSPEKLARLGIPVLQQIAKISSPEKIYLALQGIDKNASPTIIEQILWRDEALAEESFWELVTQMYHIQEKGGIDILKSDGVKFSDGEDRSSYLARALIESPSKIKSLFMHLREKNSQDFSEKTFQIFKCRLRPDDVNEKLARIDSSTIQEMLGSHFEGRGYGVFRQVIPAGKDQHWGFLVNRGSHRVTNAVLDREEKRTFRDDRKVKTDAVFYVRETNSLWINCQSKTDGAMYAQIIGELLGQPQAFALRQDFDLSPFLRQDIGSDLLKVANLMQFVRLEVRYVDVVLTNGGNFSKPAGRGHPCLTDEYPQLSHIHPSNEMKIVKMRLVFTADGKEYADVTIKTGSIKIDIGIDPLRVSELLSHLNVWRLYANA